MPIHNLRLSYNAGEVSPTFQSRVDTEKYASACEELENFLPHVHGPIVKRPGTVFIAAQHGGGGAAARMHGFNFFGGEYGMAEFTDLSVKIWSSDTASAGPYTTAWTTAKLLTVKFAAINNLIYGVQPTTPVTRITRASAGSFTITPDFDWDWPALLDANITDISMQSNVLDNNTGDSEVSVAGGGLVVGALYEIVTPGTTNFVAVGAANNLTGTIFTATGVGSGTGTVDSIDGAGYLTSSVAYFTADNAGSWFEIAHPRGNSALSSVVIEVDDFANAFLLITGNPANNDTLTLNGRVYTFKTEGRDEADEIDSSEGVDVAQNIVNAVNTGGGGADPNADVEANIVGGLKAAGTIGNSTGTNFADNDRVTVGGKIYKAESVPPDAINHPYEFKIGATLDESLLHLKMAINREPPIDPDVPNGEYFYLEEDGITTDENPGVEAISIVADGAGFQLNVVVRKEGADGNTTALSTDSAVVDTAGFTGGNHRIGIKAKEAGAAGNAITVAESSAFLAFDGGATHLSGGADGTLTSDEIVVLGKYTVSSTGRWKGTIELQRQSDGGGWNTIQSWKSENDYNILQNLEATHREVLRLKFTGSSGTAIDGVFPRAQIQPDDGFVRGLVKVTAFISTTRVAILVKSPLLNKTATVEWSEGAWSPRRGYPRAVCFHQNRVWYAGTACEPEKLWASQLGDYENMRLTSSDDGGMAFQIAASEAQEILWLASYKKALVIGSTRAEWSAQPSDSQTALTPANPPIFTQESAYGSADIQGIVFQDSVVFVQRGARRMRKMNYDGREFQSTDLTVIANHITGDANLGISYIAGQSSRDSILWVVRGDGLLMSLTWEQEQNVFAWARHPFEADNSFCEGLGIVSGSLGDEVWLSTDRTGMSRCIERMDPGTANHAASGGRFRNKDAVHVDCSVKQEDLFSTFAVVTGLSHLNGKEVWAWTHTVGGDVYTTQPAMSGLDRAAYTVSGGQITLTTAANTAIVGIPVESRAIPTRPEIPMRDGTSQGRGFNIVSAVARVYNASHGCVVWVAEETDPHSTRLKTTEGEIVTDDIWLPHPGHWTNSAQISVKHLGAGPFTMLNIVASIDVGGEKSMKNFANLGA